MAHTAPDIIVLQGRLTMIRSFTSLFHTTTDIKLFNSKQLLKTQDNVKLLNEGYRKSYLAKIKRLVNAPDVYYDGLYEPIFAKIAELWQELPDIVTLKPEEKRITALIDNALLRACYALTIRSYVNFPSGGSEQQIKEEYALWTYVVATSALLWHCGRLCTHYMISLCDPQGLHQRYWSALEGTLLSQSEQYKIRDIDPDSGRPAHLMTPLLAQQQLTSDGFHWLTAHPQALDAWLMALNDEQGENGEISAMLSLVNQLLDGQIQLSDLVAQLHLEHTDLLQTLERLHEWHKQNLVAGLLHTEQQQHQADHLDTQAGEAFLVWLRDGLNNHSIAVNEKNAMVHITDEGVFLLHPAIFQDFCKAFPRFKNWVVVHKQFNMLGLSKLSGDDYVFSKYFSDAPTAATSQTSFMSYRSATTTQTQKGVLVVNANLLFEHQVPDRSPFIQHSTEQLAQKAQTQYPSVEQLNKNTPTNQMS